MPVDVNQSPDNAFFTNDRRKPIVRDFSQLGLNEVSRPVLGSGTFVYFDFPVALPARGFKGGTGSLEATCIATATTNVSMRAEPGGGHTRLSNQLSQIKTILGLTVSDLADVLRVQRPTVYGWMSGSQVPQRRNLERIGDLASVADEVLATLGRPMVKGAVGLREGGASLLECLCAENLDRDEIRAHLVRSVGQSVEQGVFARLKAQRGKSNSLDISVEEARERIEEWTGRPVD